VVSQLLAVIIDFNAFNKRPQEKPIILSMGNTNTQFSVLGSRFPVLVLQLPCVLICAIKTQQQQQHPLKTCPATAAGKNKEKKGADQKRHFN